MPNITPPTTDGLLRAANVMGKDGQELLTKSDLWAEWRKDKRPVSAEYQIAVRTRNIYEEKARPRFTAVRLLVSYGLERLAGDNSSDARRQHRMIMGYILRNTQ